MGLGDTFAMQCLPSSDAINRVERCHYIQEGDIQWMVKLPVHSVQFRQETQSQNGVDNGPVRSKSRLLWTSNNIEEWLNAPR